MRTRQNTDPLPGRVRAHELDRLRANRGEPAQRVHEHREETEYGGDHDLRPRAQRSEPSIRDRRERDDRDGVRGDHVRHQGIAERPPTGQDECGGKREPAAEDEAADRLLECDPARPSAARRDYPRRPDDVGERRAARTARLRAQGGPTATRRGRAEDDDRGRPCSPHAARSEPTRGHRATITESRQLLDTGPTVQVLAHLGDELEEARVLARLDRRSAA